MKEYKVLGVGRMSLMAYMYLKRMSVSWKRTTMATGVRQATIFSELINIAYGMQIQSINPK